MAEAKSVEGVDAPAAALVAAKRNSLSQVLSSDLVDFAMELGDFPVDPVTAARLSMGLPAKRGENETGAIAQCFPADVGPTR
jgi:hypothetical protein